MSRVVEPSRGAEIHVALDEELRRLERATVRILAAMAVVGVALAMVVGAVLAMWLGYLLAAFSALWVPVTDACR